MMERLGSFPGSLNEMSMKTKKTSRLRSLHRALLTISGAVLSGYFRLPLGSLDLPGNKKADFTMVELTGVEPVSKNSPTFRNLQFIAL